MMLDRSRPSAESRVCREGLCRYDQIFSAIDDRGPDLGNVSALLNEDASSPLVWCAYAELLSADRQKPLAVSAFEHAVTLGPQMSPVLMRVANFDFSEGRTDHALAMTNRILRQTDAFDQELFSYLSRSGIPVSKLAGVAVPPTLRAATSWFSWLRTRGSDANLSELWSWMQQNQLLDQKTATDFAWTFWQRKEFATAQHSWAEWVNPLSHGNLPPSRLANQRFREPPNGSPFDWTFIAAAGVDISRDDGLVIHFSGTDNIAFANVLQYTTVSGGRYRFSAEISGDGLTTDQGPFFHIFDPIHPAILNLEGSPFKGTISRSWIGLDIPASADTRPLVIQIERRPSQKFNNKINGTLHVYQVSLTPVR